jgi:anti-sigma regulatory factor (Ser/Thr protein kinase)
VCPRAPARHVVTDVSRDPRRADGSDGAAVGDAEHGAALGGAVHEAVLYSAPDELAQRLVPRLAPALDDGSPVVAVLDGPTRAEVRRALGDDARHVEFPEPATVHRVPAFTVAVRWARLSRLAHAPDGHATVVGQHVAGLPGCGETHWARLDIGLNVALAQLPITVLCPYRADGQELARVHATHPRVTTAQGPALGDGFRDPAAALTAFPPPPAPDLGRPTAVLAFTASDLGALRRLVAAVAARAGMDAGRGSDLVLAVNEIGSNSIEHGPGRGLLRLWLSDDGVTAEVTDTGTTMLRFPGMVAPPATGPRGRGLWLASELCDVMQVWSEPAHTVVRLRMETAL